MTGSTGGLTNDPIQVDSAIGVPLPLDEAGSVPESASTSTSSDSGAAPEAATDSWRVEVAARLERYRTRRKPRGPRYPSLLLPFDAPSSWTRASDGLQGSAFGHTGRESTAAAGEPALASNAAPNFYSERIYSEQEVPEQSAKVIEFPRSAAIPVSSRSELADPVIVPPRIVEAPEILPPPPALGGMLIEPAPQETVETPGEDYSVDSASIARRVLAALVDGSIVSVALTGSAAIFWRLNPMGGSLAPLAAALVTVAVLLWMTYAFLFVVYTGSTPGMRVLRLRLARFDDSPLNRRMRRWRVLASFLSAFSAGLGYLWCIIDENGLCWHDRITRTHLQLKEKQGQVRGVKAVSSRRI